MKFEEIEHKIREYELAGKTLFSSSSFQTHSLVLLHIISRINNKIPIYFINTGFLFPETIHFRDQVAAEFGLNVISLNPQIPKLKQKDAAGQFLFTCDPTQCCKINKVAPLDAILQEKDIWINGVRADQSAVRKQMEVEQAAPHNTLRFHPMLDWTRKDVFDYIKLHKLPQHPLDAKGYASIGCEPCTRTTDLSDERAARWFGMNKVECGLNTDLIETKKES